MELLPLVIGLGFGVLFAFICYRMALSRGRQPAGWAVFGFFLGIIPVIILAIIGQARTA